MSFHLCLGHANGHFVFFDQKFECIIRSFPCVLHVPHAILLNLITSTLQIFYLVFSPKSYGPPPSHIQIQSKQASLSNTAFVDDASLGNNVQNNFYIPILNSVLKCSLYRKCRFMMLNMKNLQYISALFFSRHILSIFLTSHMHYKHELNLTFLPYFLTVDYKLDTNTNPHLIFCQHTHFRCGLV